VTIKNTFRKNVLVSFLRL